MPAIDLDALRQPVEGDNPCGQDLDGSQALYELELAAKEPEHRMFDDHAADERNWRQIRDHALGLLAQSKDLRVAVLLVRSLLRTDGLPGARGGLALIRQLIDGFWPNLYPRLDADDDNDPTERLNVLRELCGPSMLEDLRAVPLVSARGLGELALKDLMIAAGELKPNGAAAPTPELIAGAFGQCDLEALRAQAAAARSALEQVQAITTAVRQQIGAGPEFDLGPLDGLLTRIVQSLDPQVTAREGQTVPGETAGAEADGDSATNGAGSATAAAPALAASVRNRDDVIRMLDKICEYYERYEPSSPVPVLMARAKRLVSMSFVEIVRDLADKGLPQIETIVGKESKG